MELRLETAPKTRMERTLRLLTAVAATNATLLLMGESGSGKGAAARKVHESGPRKDRPFVSVHCGAIPTTLLESVLFGHLKGAFTDAKEGRKGAFERARGGTIFLDEVGTASPDCQVRLLEVLDTGEVVPVGGSERIPCNARVIAATNEQLEKLVAAGRFRADLFYRLSVFPVEIPPLRERKDEIPGLIETFVRNSSEKYGTVIREGEAEPTVTRCEAETVERLAERLWLGNIRELEHAIERAVILAIANGDRELTEEHFDWAEPVLHSEPGVDAPLSEVIIRHFCAVLKRNHGHISQTARALGIARQTATLWKKTLAEHGTMEAWILAKSQRFGTHRIS